LLATMSRRSVKATQSQEEKEQEEETDKEKLNERH
jgi:hypothetical protein